MAGGAPFFLTGANAKIRVNGVTLAFVTDLSYSVSIQHAPAKILGQYEANSLEPISYSVIGAFTVLRYVKNVANKVQAPSRGMSRDGNGIGNWGPSGEGGLTGAIKKYFNLADGRAYDAADPSTLDNAAYFEIEIHQKINATETVPVARARGCRITNMDFSINKRGAAIERYTFMATYLDEDSFLADFSGQGQHLGG